MISRRVFLAGSAATVGSAALFLAGCEAVSGPRPDAALVALWSLALRDINDLAGDTSAIDPSGKYTSVIAAAIDVRKEHASLLETEVRRVCGKYDDGTVDDECVASPPLAESLFSGTNASTDSVGDTGSGGGANASRDANATREAKATREASDEFLVPDLLHDSRESVALLDALSNTRALKDPYEALLATCIDGGLVLQLRAMNVDWDELVPAIPADAAELGNDVQHLSVALRSEFALIYGMAAATPRIEPAYRESTLTSADRHRTLRDRAVAIFTACGVTPPVAEPGYTEVADAPAPETKPAEFAEALEAQCAAAWRTALVECEHPQARLFALGASGLAHAGAAVFAATPGAATPGLNVRS